MKARELAELLLKHPDATVLMPDMDAMEVSGIGGVILHPPTARRRETVELMPAGYD